jgi:hypothetical protein
MSRVWIRSSQEIKEEYCKRQVKEEIKEEKI